MKVNVFLCGLTLLVLSIVSSFFFPSGEKKVYGKIIDKYKGVARHYDSERDGGDYNSNELYLVYQYPNEPIDRESVDPDVYYKFYMGENVVKTVVVETTMNTICGIGFIVGIILCVIGVFRGLAYDSYI